jgi:hypothetical protein
LVGTTTATLNGNVTANGLTTNAWFEWGTDSTLTTSTSTSSQSIGSGTTSQAVNAVLTGLSRGTTYYYRVVASNSLGTTPGNIANFIPDYVGSYSGTSHNSTSGIDNVVDIIITAYSATELTGTIETGNNGDPIPFSSGSINGDVFHAEINAIFDTTTMDGTFTSDGLTLSGTFLVVSTTPGVPDQNGTFTVTKQ